MSAVDALLDDATPGLDAGVVGVAALAVAAWLATYPSLGPIPAAITVAGAVGLGAAVPQLAERAVEVARPEVEAVIETADRVDVLLVATVVVAHGLLDSAITAWAAATHGTGIESNPLLRGLVRESALASWDAGMVAFAEFVALKLTLAALCAALALLARPALSRRRWRAGVALLGAGGLLVVANNALAVGVLGA